MLVNIPNLVIIRGGDGCGKEALSEKIGESYESWGYFHQCTREELEQLKCVIISGDVIYLGLFGAPLDIFNLQQFKNSDIFLSEVLDEIEICLRQNNLITIVVEGVLCYKYLDQLNSFFKDRATILNVEMVNGLVYSEGFCVPRDETLNQENNLYPYSRAVTTLKEITIGSERPELYHNAYQYFPEFLYQTQINSNSPEKLALLNLPALEGRRVLDVGCNLGYFVFQYSLLGASAEGVDIDCNLIKKASKFRNIMYSVNNVKFYCADIFKFAEKKYDLITFLSGLHYFEKPRNVLEKLHSLLNKNGLLVLEIGVSEEKADQVFYEKLENYFFPNEKALEFLIQGLFQISYSGPSIINEGDCLPRKIYHLYRI